jgi:hypothetical protein
MSGTCTRLAGTTARAQHPLAVCGAAKASNTSITGAKVLGFLVPSRHRSSGPGSQHERAALRDYFVTAFKVLS